MDDNIRERVGEAADGAVRGRSRPDGPHPRVGALPQAKPPAPEQTFAADDDPPSGLMEVWEAGSFRAEIRFLRTPDTDEPMDHPWHAKVIGPEMLPFHDEPSPAAPLWSGSFDDREEAVETAKKQLRKQWKRFQRRSSGGEGEERTTALPQATQDTLAHIAEDGAYAVFDPETAGFVRKGTFGQVVFRTEAEAENLANDAHVVVRLEPTAE